MEIIKETYTNVLARKRISDDLKRAIELINQAIIKNEEDLRIAKLLNDDGTLNQMAMWKPDK